VIDVQPSAAWKPALAIVLGVGIVLSACARAPRRAISGSDLRRLVLCALCLYAVGGFASLTHHPPLAALLYAAGIVVCAVAAWLSRGTDSEDPPEDDEPIDERPPPEPDGMPWFDFAQFEREFRSYCERERQLA
jgi:hypothetical protein